MPNDAYQKLLATRPKTDSLLLGWTDSATSRLGFHTGRSAPQHTNEPIWYDGPHLATVAPSGSGKCVSAAAPALLTYDGPAIVFDVKGELYSITHRRRREAGYREIKLDPFHVLGPDTDRCNFFDTFDLPNADLDLDGQTLAKILSMGRGFSKDPFWELSANGLNAGLMTYIAACEPPEKRNLVRLLELLHGNDVVYSLAVLLDTLGKKIPKFAYQEIAAFLELPDRETRPSTLATAQSFVKGLNAARVAETFCNSTFSLEELRQNAPLTIYMIIPPDRMASHACVIGLWVATFLKTIFSRNVTPKRRTLLILDEAAALGNFPPLETAVTLCRTYGLRVWSFWQSLQQIEAAFPTGWRTILDNGAIQSFGTASRLAARELSAIVDVRADELMSLGPNRQVLQLSDGEPLRCRKLNYLRDAPFAGLFDENRYFAAGTEMADATAGCAAADSATGAGAARTPIDAAPVQHDTVERGLS
ncbi:MAG: type IV secretory system conjugative DNA transfer family protein [Pirellulales bacterium]